MPTTEKPREGASKATADTPAPDFALSDRDVRRKRPPVLSFLLRLDTLRSVVRVGTLLMLDCDRHLHGDPHGAVAEGRAADRRLAAARAGGRRPTSCSTSPSC